MGKKVKLSTAKRRAWQAFSRYIRLRGSTDGYNQCVTCGSTHPISELDAGHFISKTRGLSIYFHPQNVWPQCQKCNRFLEGNKHLYTLYMLDKFDRETVEGLEILARSRHKYTVSDYLALEAEYKDKAHDLE